MAAAVVAPAIRVSVSEGFLPGAFEDGVVAMFVDSVEGSTGAVG